MSRFTSKLFVMSPTMPLKIRLSLSTERFTLSSDELEKSPTVSEWHTLFYTVRSKCSNIGEEKTWHTWSKCKDWCQEALSLKSHILYAPGEKPAMSPSLDSDKHLALIAGYKEISLSLLVHSSTYCLDLDLAPRASRGYTYHIKQSALAARD